MSLIQPNAPLTVSQLNRQVKQLLESQYPAVPVQGEISTLSRPASGHIYFTLKDQGAQIRCAMFKGSLTRNRYIPKQGDEVVAYGRLSLYEGRGDYQLIVNTMQPVGEGALQAAFFQLKEQLAAEGLFQEQLKKPLPSTIRTVGIVTSATGAALHDILTVLNRRFPAINVILYPSQVQGAEATETLVQAIQTADARQEVDILIVGRGGGSLEDLWCFNTEPVARAIFACQLPVISAVGHEVDVSISDFVADIRAATPSQAAEMVSPDQYELMQRLDVKERRMQQAITARIRNALEHVGHLRKRVKNPNDLVLQWKEKLNAVEKRLYQATSQAAKQRQQQLDTLNHRLQRSNPGAQLQGMTQRLGNLTGRLQSGIHAQLEPKTATFGRLVAKLNVLSPLSTLQRGYSITRTPDGTVIQSSQDVSENDELETLLREGKIVSKVTKIVLPDS